MFQGPHDIILTLFYVRISVACLLYLITNLAKRIIAYLSQSFSLLRGRRKVFVFIFFVFVFFFVVFSFMFPSSTEKQISSSGSSSLESAFVPLYLYNSRTVFVRYIFRTLKSQNQRDLRTSWWNGWSSISCTKHITINRVANVVCLSQGKSWLVGCLRVY